MTVTGQTTLNPGRNAGKRTFSAEHDHHSFINPIALRKAKTCRVLAILSGIG